MGRADPCCSKCRTPSGVCATGHTCGHHRRTLDGPSPISYRDPTANDAIWNVMHPARAEEEERRRRE